MPEEGAHRDQESNAYNERRGQNRQVLQHGFAPFRSAYPVGVSGPRLPTAADSGGQDRTAGTPAGWTGLPAHYFAYRSVAGYGTTRMPGTARSARDCG
jgi:hypothetical protein